MKAALLLTWLSGLCLIALSGCGEDAPSLEEVKKFKGYPVYSAGEEVLGQPITRVIVGQEQVKPREQVWFFIYGDCELTRR